MFLSFARLLARKFAHQISRNCKAFLTVFPTLMRLHGLGRSLTLTKISVAKKQHQFEVRSILRPPQLFCQSIMLIPLIEPADLEQYLE
jgi:hypothetical protein